MKLQHASTSRLEAFSDGVIAVIVTIMVLELHVPHEDGWHGLLRVMPRIGIYLLSFVMVGIYWVNHHELCRRVERLSFSMVWANMAWLFALSLIPYFTDYIGEKHFDSFSTALYAIVMTIAGLSYGVLRITVISQQRKSGSFDKLDRAEARKHAASLLCYLVAIPMAWGHPAISLGLVLMVTLIWIIPSLGTNCETSEHPHPEAR